MNKDLSENCADVYPLHGIYIFNNVDRKDTIVVCDHDFNPVIEANQLDKNYTGFLLEYHCNFPWDDTPWIIEDIEELIQLLETGLKKLNFSHADKNNPNALINFLYDAFYRKQNVSIATDWGGLSI